MYEKRTLWRSFSILSGYFWICFFIKPKNYQQVPSGGKSSTITTPVAVEPTVQKQTLQLPDPEINRTKNTVTTTTLRPSTAP